MFLRLIGVSALVLALTGPAAAADRPATDLVLTLVIGALDNATVAITEDASTVVQHPEAGVYFLEFAKRQAVDAWAVEKSHCLFDITIDVSGSSVGGVELDGNKLTGVGVTVTKTYDNFKDYQVVLKGADGVQMQIDPKGTITPLPTPQEFLSSITQADIEQAGAELITYCKSST
jgi:hypothetical protein